MTLIRLLGMWICIATGCGSASAAITFSLSNTTVTAGSTARISLNASSNANENLGAFELDVDVDDAILSGAVPNWGVDDPNDNFFGAAATASTGEDGEDAIVSAFGGNVSLNTEPEHLLFLTLDVAASVAPGVYQISFVDTPFDTATLTPAAPATIHSDTYTSSATITVTAVPEPGTVALCGLLAVGTALRQYRRRRRAALATTEAPAACS